MIVRRTTENRFEFKNDTTGLDFLNRCIAGDDPFQKHHPCWMDAKEKERFYSELQ